MPPDVFLADIINPGLLHVEAVGGPKPSNDARRLLLAIAMQESGPGLNARYQNSPSTSPGPARGWWQFEQGGGVVGVLSHAASSNFAAATCARLSVVAQPAAVWRAIEGNDALSCSFARLLMWTDPPALPNTEGPAWDFYMRLWRPGKPHREVWQGNWQTADATVSGSLTA